MTVCFCENIYVKTFDETNHYPLKTSKCKEFDGPNHFSIFMNQLVILTIHNIIHDASTLKEKFNDNLLNFYQTDILNEIDTILYKFTILNNESITLYYNDYHIVNQEDTIHMLTNLYKLIQNI